MATKSFRRTVWHTAILGRCPECAQTSMFSGIIEMHERCASCDLRYQTSPGAWLGAIAIGYGIGALIAIVLAMTEIAYRPIRELGLDPAWTIVVIALVATGLLYRWAKAAWFALLYQYDFMAFGDEPPGPQSRASTDSRPIDSGTR